jgi:hypothetical protein
MIRQANIRLIGNSRDLRIPRLLQALESFHEVSVPPLLGAGQNQGLTEDHHAEYDDHGDAYIHCLSPFPE